MGRVRRGAGLAVAVLALSALATGCGEDDPFVAYCEVVQTEQTPLTEALAEGGRTGLLNALPSFERLRDAAPEDLRDEWSVVVSRVTVLRDALEDAGIDPGTYDPADPPPDLSDAERAAIEVGASSVATPQVQAALDGIEQQARDVCKTPLVIG